MTQLIVALDDGRALEALPELIAAGARWFKIDPWFLLNHHFPYDLVEHELSLFLDLKLYQPAVTVERTARQAWALGAKLLTVFADSGMLKAASQCRTHDDQRVIAVGPLTDGTGSPRDVSNALRHGEAQGVVCRPDAIAEYRRVLSKDARPVFVCPGVRTDDAWSVGGHRAIFRPRTAARLGADFVVVGRPIYAAPDPAAAVRSILEEFENVHS